MFLGAMLDLGLDREKFLNQLQTLPLNDEYSLEIRKGIRGGITGTDVIVKTNEHHPHRNLLDIYAIIDSSKLDYNIKQKSKQAFYKLALAEGKVHGKLPEEIHFHEVGAIDSIVDIVGACILINMLNPTKVYASAVNVGGGTVDCAHGILPVPAPAALELLEGVPIYSGDELGELTTPTGALLLNIFVDRFGGMPLGIPEKIGYGLGKAERKSPNVLRAVLLKEFDRMESEYAEDVERDAVAILESNIDDMNPQLYEAIIERLFQEGALDVFLTPIIMKKSRPAVKLTCLCTPDKKQHLGQIILKETTTLGVRELMAGRIKLSRKIEEIKTPLGNLKVKIAKIGDEIIKASPEYEDMKLLAKNNNIPLIKAYEIVKQYLTV